MPNSPAEHIVRRKCSRARRLLGIANNSDSVSVDRLQHPADDWRDRVAPATLSGPLLQELDDHLDGQLKQASSQQRLQVLLWPPGDQDNLIQRWAELHGCHVLQAPTRHELIHGLDFNTAGLGTDAPVVITDRAHWFVRHRTGLASGRSLLRDLASTNTTCVIACNSWAWPWLSKVAAIDLLLPKPVTFTAFDAVRLATWFRCAADNENLRFRTLRSGDDVLLTDADGEPEYPYLRELAALSLGIPWVACQLWRDGMRKEQQNAEHGETEKTVWLVPPVDHLMPSGHEHDARRIMHTILLHGGLQPDVPIARLVIITGAVLSIIPLILNITFQNFLVITGAAGVAIGFAFKDYISSLIAGVVAVFEKLYRPGDWVEASGHYGEVQHVGLRAVRLRTPLDDIVTVPNATLWTHSIVNSNDGDHTLLCVAHFYLDPLHDAQRVRLALEDVALTSAYLRYEHPVVVILKQTPYGSHYQLKAYPFDMRDQFLFISDLTARGKQAVIDCGASEIAVPTAISSPGRSTVMDPMDSDSAN